MVTSLTDQPLPERSLLARHRTADCYRDAFMAQVPGKIPLSAFITAFYSSAAFRAERLALYAIGRGANRADIAALAEGRSESFAAWHVEAREKEQILLCDFKDRTCSWLAVEAAGEATKLWFGSAVRHPEKPLVKALMPVHRWYAKTLLRSALKGLA